MVSAAYIGRRSGLGPNRTLFGPDGIFESVDGPQSLTNTQKLSLPANTAVGTQVQVTDGFVVSGAGIHPASGIEQDGLYAAAGATVNGKPTFKHATNSNWLIYNSTQWYFSDAGNDSGDSAQLAAVGNEDYPWQANWSAATPSVPTLTHPAVQQLAAPSTAQGGVFVSGGTQDGVYATQNVFNGRAALGLLGTSLGEDPGSSASFIYWDADNSRWQIIAGDTTSLYYSLSNVATPDLASNWNASDDTPAPITVTSVTQGQLVAGLKIGSGTYRANESNERNVYLDVLGVAATVFWNPDDVLWQSDIAINLGNVAFPFQGTPEISVIQDSVASEANWEVVP